MMVESINPDNRWSGRYAPGSKLRMETLKETYGGSVNVLRENLVRLSAEGLVEAEDQKGFRVASLTPDRLRDLTRLRINRMWVTHVVEAANGAHPTSCDPSLL